MDDSRLKFGYQSCSFVLVMRCRSLQKYPVFGSFADIELSSDKIRKFPSLVLGYLTNCMILESISVLF